MRTHKVVVLQALSVLALALAAASAMARSTAAAPIADVSLPALPGWTRTGPVRTFGPDNLYEYVDGAAELFLSLGFEDLSVTEYANGRGGSAVVEIYRHESPLHAFGMYAQERPSEGEYLAMGAEGYAAPPYLNFVIGDAYVKLSADGLGDRTAETLRAFAEATASRLGGEARLPPVLSLFPADGRVAHSERFAARDLLGYDFLRNGFTADYAADGQRFRLFIVQTKTPDEAREMLRRYLERAGLPVEAVREGRHTVPDKYNGEVAALWEGRTLSGVVGLADRSLRERYLRMLDEAIARQP
jgi:hypothetical protein